MAWWVDTFTWQNGRQLAGMSNGSTTANFVYNKDGLRVQKTVNGVVTKYTLHGKNVVHMTRGSDDLHFFYDAENRPAVVVYNGVSYAYVKNLQGDIIAILDSAYTPVVQYTYDAWGNPTGCTGSMASTIGVLNPFRYRGYVYDEETGLYYLRNRYYAPEKCRFINLDIIVTGNMFAYCNNMPILQVDKSGCASVSCFDENGHEVVFQSMIMGCSGGAYYGGISALTPAVDATIVIMDKVFESIIAVGHSLEAEAGVGIGMGGMIDLLVLEVGATYRTDFVNVRLNKDGIRLGKLSEYCMGLSVGIPKVDNLSIGGYLSASYAHPFSSPNCTCGEHDRFVSSRSCAETDYTFSTDSYMTWGVSAYVGVGATLRVTLNLDQLSEELKDIWD